MGTHGHTSLLCQDRSDTQCSLNLPFSHYTLHTAHYTLYTTHCTLYTAHFTLHTKLGQLCKQETAIKGRPPSYPNYSNHKCVPEGRPRHNLSNGEIVKVTKLIDSWLANSNCEMFLVQNFPKFVLIKWMYSSVFTWTSPSFCAIALDFNLIWKSQSQKYI